MGMDSRETCRRLISAIVRYFWRCPFFEFWWSLRDAVIFQSCVMDTHDRCTKIIKSPTVSNGIGASSFEIWTPSLAQLLTLGTLTNSRSFIFGDSNWKFCQVGYPVGTLKPDIQMWTFLISSSFLMLLFFSDKNQNLLNIQEQCVCKLGKIQCIRRLGKTQSELKLCLVFIIDF